MRDKKAKKEAELAKAKQREADLNESLKDMEETNKKLEKEADEANIRTSKLEDDLQQEKSEASSLRSRITNQENSQVKDLRRRIQQLEEENARLTAEAKKNQGWLSSWF